MKRKDCYSYWVAIVLSLGNVSLCHGGSERFIMTMTEQRMAHDNLVFVRMFGPDGAALESDALKQMVIRARDCASGPALTLTKEYKLGYSPKSRLVGVYLFPQAWSDKSLCFDLPGKGTAQVRFDPAEDQQRVIEVTIGQH